VLQVAAALLEPGEAGAVAERADVGHERFDLLGSVGGPLALGLVLRAGGVGHPAGRQVEVRPGHAGLPEVGPRADAPALGAVAADAARPVEDLAGRDHVGVVELLPVDDVAERVGAGERRRRQQQGERQDGPHDHPSR
jgi:hypothetical protein